MNTKNYKLIRSSIGLVMLLSLVVFFSCNSKQKQTAGFYDENVETIVLQGVDIKTNDPNLATGGFLGMHDSIMYMQSFKMDTFINAYRLKNDSLILSCRFLNRGQGPYEIGNIFSDLYDKKSGTISFFENDAMLTKGYVIDLNIENGISNKESWKLLDFSEEEGYTFGQSFVYISDSLLLAIGGKIDNKEILSIIHLDNPEIVTPLELWPDDGFEGSNLTKQHVYKANAKLFKNYTSNKYLYVCKLGKYMEIFRIENNKMADRQPVCELFPEYEMSEIAYYLTKKDETNRGFHVYTTDSLIYASPIEFSIDQYRAGETYKGYDLYYNENVYVFDWDGNLIKKYELDTPFYELFVGSNDRVMYTLTSDLETDDSIVKKYILK